MFNILSLFILLVALVLISTQNSFILIFLLISVFFLIFILFLLMGVNFLALSFLIVYIGAVAILFLFTVMLLGQQTAKKDIFSVSLKLFLVSFFITIPTIFFLRTFSFWYYNNLYNNSLLNNFNSFFLESNNCITLSDPVFINAASVVNLSSKVEPIATLESSNPFEKINGEFLEPASNLNLNLEESDFKLVFNETLDFIQNNSKNETLLDIYVISLKLYEDFSSLFILSGLLLLIAMLAVVGLIVPPKHKFTKS
jgi:NADH-ubiquinone oxidoreductase chain 6